MRKRKLKKKNITNKQSSQILIYQSKTGKIEFRGDLKKTPYGLVSTKLPSFLEETSLLFQDI